MLIFITNTIYQLEIKFDLIVSYLTPPPPNKLNLITPPNGLKAMQSFQCSVVRYL